MWAREITLLREMLDNMKKVLLVFVTVLLIGFACNGCNSSKTSKANNVSKLKTSTPKKEKEHIYNVGDTANNGRLAITIYSCQPWTDQLLTTGSNAAPAGFHYLLMDIAVKNNDAATRDVYWFEMSLKSPDGFKYNAWSYVPLPHLPEGPLQPDQIARGNVTFQVPTDKPLNFVFDRSPYGGQVTFRIQ